MDKNIDWVYRKLSGYDILINIKTNNILTISPLLGELFSGPIFTCDTLENWKIKNQIDDFEWKCIAESLQSKGVINE